MPNNANNKKKTANNSTNNKNTVVNKVVKNVKKMNITSMLLIVVVLIQLYLVFFDGKKHKVQLFNHRHQRNREGFNNNNNSLTEEDKCVLVLFHADWCGHCKNFMPTWNKAKTSLQSSDVVLKDFEAETNKEVMKENEVSSFPTLKFFKKNGEIVEYEGDRTLEALEEFIEKNKD